MELVFLKKMMRSNLSKQQQEEAKNKSKEMRTDSLTNNSFMAQESMREQDSRASETAPTRTIPQASHNETDVEAQAPIRSSSHSVIIGPEMISDAVLGLSDGLTVPFALTAGLSVLQNTRYVVLGGLAELIAGAISMGLGGFVGAKSAAASYQRDVRETRDLIETSPTETSRQVRDVFAEFGLPDEDVTKMNTHLHSSPHQLEAFLMRFSRESTSPLRWQAYITASTLAAGYFVGGIIPLIPYFIIKHNVTTALHWSIGIMGVTLFVFGYIKTCVVDGWIGWRKVEAAVLGGSEMLLVGGAAAASAYGLVRAIDRGSFVS